MHRSLFFQLACTAVIVSFLGLLAAGCASSGSSTGESGSTAETSTSTSASASTPASTGEAMRAADVEADLRSAAARWDNVPHVLGGTTQRGVDCSGLVQSVYATEFDRSLPRTTEQQVKTGQRVDRSSLQPGDLLFFRHERKKYHVGIYVSEGKFLHASSSSGVTLSPLDRSYWNERWWQARRLLAIAHDSSSQAPSQDSSQTPARPTRTETSSGVGW